MDWQWAVQQVEEHASMEDARAFLDFVSEQDGYMGARIIPPAGKGWWMLGEPKQVWKVQVFYADCGEAAAGNLPDGLRRCLLPPGICRECGIAQEG